MRSFQGAPSNLLTDLTDLTVIPPFPLSFRGPPGAHRWLNIYVCVFVLRI